MPVDGFLYHQKFRRKKIVALTKHDEDFNDPISYWLFFLLYHKYKIYECLILSCIKYYTKNQTDGRLGHL